MIQRFSNATVGELAAAVGRPKSTVAHHVKVLVDAGNQADRMRATRPTIRCCPAAKQ
jgi:predicted transcriptional regulator